MKVRKVSESKPTHHILVRVLDRDGEKRIGRDGREILPTKWVQTEEINLGSIVNPNKKIIEVKLVPILYPEEENKEDLDG